MKKEDLILVSETINEHITEIAGNSGLSYLDCGCEEWKDGYNKVHSLSDMDESYIKNCLNEIKRGIELCNRDYVVQISQHLVADKILGLDSYNFNASEKLEIRRKVRDEMIKLLNEKKGEMDKELNNK